MATTARLYRTARIGTGARGADGKIDGFRSAFDRHLPASLPDGSHYDVWSIDGKPVMYVFAVCEPAIHALAAADADIQPLSPEFESPAAMQAWLDGTLDLTQAQRNIIEGDGIPIDDLTGSITRRQVFRRIALYFALGAIMSRSKDPVTKQHLVLDFLTRNLATTVGQLTVTQRNRIRDWMTAQGLSTASITNATTVRQVLKFIVANIDLRPNRFTRAEF